MGKKKEKPSSEPTNCTQLESNEVQAQLTEAEDGVPSKKPKKHKRKKSSKKERDQEKQMVPSKQADLVETLMLEEDDQEILIDDVEMDVDDSLSDSASGAKLLIKTPDTPADKNLKVMQKSKSEKSKSSSNSKKSSKKRDGNKGEEDTDSEEERWLDAIESGKLEEVDDELKRIKNPRLMTARQRALMEKRSDGVDEGYAAIPAEPLLALPTGFKEKVLTEEMIAKKAIKSKRRREQVIEKREEDKKKTVDRLLKKQDSKISKVTRSKCLKKSAPLITYLDKEGIFLSYPFGTELPPIVPLAERNVLKPLICGTEGCLNLKRYSCSRTGVPLCSLECYKRNFRVNNVTDSVTRAEIGSFW